jgi:tetratricopeptide (TPR) repeat protein
MLAKKRYAPDAAPVDSTTYAVAVDLYAAKHNTLANSSNSSVSNEHSGSGSSSHSNRSLSSCTSSAQPPVVDLLPLAQTHAAEASKARACGNIKAALQQLSFALRLAPDSWPEKGSLYSDRASCHLEYGYYEAAAADLERALSCAAAARAVRGS